MSAMRVHTWFGALLVLSMVTNGCGPAAQTTSENDASPTSDGRQFDGAPNDGEVSNAPVFRNPVTMPDAELATQALERINACKTCHGITRGSMRYWKQLTDASATNCLTDLHPTTAAQASTMLDCLKNSTMPGALYSPAKLGIYATAGKLPWFEYVFGLAFGANAASARANFIAQAHMPRTGPAFDQSDFDIVAEYFARNLPLLDQRLPPDTVVSNCTPSISPTVSTHLTAMRTDGWAARHHDASLHMFGCVDGAAPSTCLTDKTRKAAWENGNNGVIRLLFNLPHSTQFWTRSSADGRFAAHGAAGADYSAAVIDLQRNRNITTDGYYDPAFFPDNSGFVFQTFEPKVCKMSVLTNNPNSIAFGNNSACSTQATVGLYQSVAATLGGGDAWTIDSQFRNDDGGHGGGTLNNPAAFFSSEGFLHFTPLINNGNGYTARTPVTLSTPFEGDAVLSPSGKMLVSRVAGPNSAQIGMVLRKVNATLTGNTYAINAPEMGRYCFNGGKPAFSYDERYLVVHRYVEASDAVELGFTGANDSRFVDYLAKGASNIYVIDLLTGATRRITNMRPGEYAVYPHFRADGWIYFVVRAFSYEYLVASGAVLAN